MRGAWRDDRWAVVAVVAASVVAGVGWGWRTRPMGDSWSYRVAGQVVTGGWEHLTDRTPGYPLLLWATGSLHHETHLLFVVQLLLHAAAVLVAVRLAHRLGIGRRGRVAVAVLLCAPPEMILVVTSGSEALTQFLLALVAWFVVRWSEGRRAAWLAAAGVSLGALAWVRPSFALLAVPVGVVVAVAAGRGRRPAAMAAVAIPALLLVGSLVGVHATRFDAVTLTPLTGWYLGSRTSTFVDRLPASEPARSILVDERDRQLLLGDSVDAPNYSFAVRARLRSELGLSPRELDEYVLDLHLGLIVRHPFEYLDAVTTAGVRYVQIDTQAPIQGLGRPVVWSLALVHLVLAGLAALAAATLFGSALRRELDRRSHVAIATCVAIAGYAFASSIAVETGTPRLRTPTDPMVVLLLVAGVQLAWRTWRGGAVGEAPPADRA